MSSGTENIQGNVPKMETNIVFEAPQKTVAQTIGVWLVKTVISLVVLFCGGYVFLNFTANGVELKAKYEKNCRETMKLLDDGIDFCRFYISHFGHPPASPKEVIKFQTERIGNPFKQYRLPDGRNLPYWNAKDGFGHEIDIQVNPQSRTIRLTSPGIVPISGNMPAFFNCVREASY